MTKQVMKPRRKAKLPQAPPMEPRHKRTLVVVADGARARFFEPRHDTHSLVPASQADMVAPESRLANQEIVTDKPRPRQARPGLQLGRQQHPAWFRAGARSAQAREAQFHRRTGPGPRRGLLAP